MVFADCRVCESQPIFDFVPFVVGTAKAISSVTTRALYEQLAFEGIGYSGFAVLNFCKGYGHFFLLPDGSPVFRNLSACLPDDLFRDSYKLHFLFMGFGSFEFAAMLRSHRLAFLVGVFFCFERTRARNPNKFIVVRVPLYDNPTGIPRLLHHQSRDTLVAYVFRRNSQVRRGRLNLTKLTFLGGHGDEGRPPLLYVLASALRASRFYASRL